MALDHSLDYRTFCNREAVTLAHVTTASTTPDAVADAKRRPVSLREQQASYGVYTAGDTNWHLPVVQVSGVVKPRDRITDADGVVWTVLEALKVNLGSMWRCVCRALAIAGELKDTIDIEIPGVDQGPTGARQNVVWTAAYEDLPARVQPDRQDEWADRGKKATARRYLVYLDQQVTPHNAAGDFGLVKWGSIYLEITGYRDAEKITDLPVLECTLHP